jgi:hypothetical protein
MSGKWNSLRTQPPFDPSTMLLLTDGPVICNAANSTNWWRLSPDTTGGYLNGTWSQLASMKNARLYYASAVLADGRVFVAGGEYAGSYVEAELAAAEIYDPLLDQWSDLPIPPGWTRIGDAPCCVLTDGRVLLGDITNPQAAVWDPAANTWTPTKQKDDACSEESWTLLPDGTVLTAECTNHPKAERYFPYTNEWSPAGTTPAGSDLVESASIEIGPAVLLPDGRVFAIGATGYTAIYDPAAASGQPNWTAGPSFEQLRQAKDAPACLLPNGRVLCTVGTAAVGESYPGPTYFYEFDGTTLVKVDDPPNAADKNAGPYEGRLLLLPTGDVLFAKSGEVYVYTPDPASGVPSDAWRPVILNGPTVVAPGQTYPLQGYQLNGLSQAVSYGDDASMATNYPIVRVDASGQVFYARTFGMSYMGVAGGQANTEQICQVTFPPNLPNGKATLRVVANGIASLPIPIAITAMPAPPLDFFAINMLKASLESGPIWLTDSHGPSPILYDGEPDAPTKAVEDEVRRIYADLIASYTRLRELGRTFFVPGKNARTWK